MRNKSSNLSNSNVLKVTAHNEKYRHYSEIPKFVLANERHWIRGKGGKSHNFVTDCRRMLLNKKKLKRLKPQSLNLPTPVKIYINESLCPYYKKLWDAKGILLFWVSNGSIRIKSWLTKRFPSSLMTVIWRNSSLVIHWLQIPITFYMCLDIILGCVSKFNLLFVTLRVIFHHLAILTRYIFIDFLLYYSCQNCNTT